MNLNNKLLLGAASLMLVACGEAEQQMAEKLNFENKYYRKDIGFDL